MPEQNSLITNSIYLNLYLFTLTQIYTSLETVYGVLFLWCSRRGAAVCDKYQIVNGILEPPTHTHQYTIYLFTQSTKTCLLHKVLLIQVLGNGFRKCYLKRTKLELVHRYRYLSLRTYRLQVLMSTICFNDQAQTHLSYSC